MSFEVVDKKWCTYYIDIIRKKNFVAKFTGLQKLVYLHQPKCLKEVRTEQPALKTKLNILEEKYF
jgi:hypothetical protein